MPKNGNITGEPFAKEVVEQIEARQTFLGGPLLWRRTEFRFLIRSRTMGGPIPIWRGSWMSMEGTVVGRMIITTM
jgi:hypothetical protein